jgi:GntR family transcriptional repressor for pyruvate dehydrogenase complex
MFKMKKNLKVNLPELIAQDLEYNIQTGNWNIGDKLPSEGQLAEEYGVTRITVRMALNRLAAIGLIDIRNGDGSYVKQYNLDEFTLQSATYVLNDDNVSEFIVFRKIVEIESIRIFFDHYDKSLLTEIKDIFDNFKIFIDHYDFNAHSTNEFIDEVKIFEWDFHRTIVALSDNYFLISFYNYTKSYLDMFFANIVNHRISHKGLQGFIDSSLTRHQGMVDALYSKDFEKYTYYVNLMLSFDLS